MNSAGIIENLSLKLKLGKDPDDTLFSETAEGIVRELENDRFGREKNKIIKIAQIRNFYNDLLSIKGRVELKSPSGRIEAFRKQIPYVIMMVAKAKYAEGRENVGKKFVKYIDECVKPLNSNNLEDSYKHFNVFCSLFESVVAYATCSNIIRD